MRRKSSDASGGNRSGAVSAKDLAALAAQQREPARHIDAVQFQASYLQHQEASPWDALADSELMQEVRLGLEHILHSRPEFPVAELATFLKNRRAQRHEAAIQKAVVGGAQRLALEAKREKQEAAARQKDDPSPPEKSRAEQQQQQQAQVRKTSSTRADRDRAAPPKGTGSSPASPTGPASSAASSAAATAAVSASRVTRPLKPFTVKVSVCGTSTMPLPAEFQQPADGAGAAQQGPTGSGVASPQSTTSGPVRQFSSTAQPDGSPMKRKRRAKYTHALQVPVTPFPRSEVADPDVLAAVAAWSAVGDAAGAAPVSRWARKSFHQCGPIPLFAMMKPSATAIDELMHHLETDGFTSVSVVVLQDSDTVYIDKAPYHCPVREQVARETGANVRADTAAGWVVEAVLEKDSNTECATVTDTLETAAVSHHVHVHAVATFRARPRSLLTAERIDEIADFVLRPVDRSTPGAQMNERRASQQLHGSGTSRDALIVVSYVDDDTLQQAVACAHCILSSRLKANQVARLRRADAEAMAERNIEEEHVEAEARIMQLRRRRQELHERQAARDERRKKHAGGLKMQISGGHEHDNRAASGAFQPPMSKHEIMKILDNLRHVADEREVRRVRNEALFDRMLSAEKSRAVAVIRGLVRRFLRAFRRKRAEQQRQDADSLGVSPNANAAASLTPTAAVPAPVGFAGDARQSPPSLSVSGQPASTSSRSPAAMSRPGSQSGPLGRTLPPGSAGTASPSSPTMPGLTHVPGFGAVSYDTANEEYERDVNYAAVRLAMDECLLQYSDVVMTESSLPPPMPRAVGMWMWNTRRLKPQDPEDCSSEDEAWSVDYSQRTYLPPLTTRHTHINPRLSLVQALVDSECDWRHDLFDSRVLYSGVPALQKRSMKMLVVSTHLLLVSVYSFLRCSSHSAVSADAAKKAGGAALSTGARTAPLHYREWLDTRHPRIVEFLRNPNLSSVMVPEKGLATLLPSGPADLHQYTFVRYPSVAQPPQPAAPPDAGGATAGEPATPSEAGQALAPVPPVEPKPTSIAAARGGRQASASASGVPGIDVVGDGGPLTQPKGADDFAAAAAAAVPTKVTATSTDPVRWYGTAPELQHLAVPLPDLVVDFTPPKSKSMLPLAEQRLDPGSQFTARRLHPLAPIVLADVNASTRGLHALATTLAMSAASKPPATPNSPSHRPAAGGAAGGSGQGLLIATDGMTGAGSGVMGVRSDTSQTLGGNPSLAANPTLQGSTSGGGGGSSTSTGASKFVWWFAGVHPLLYVGGHPHAAVLRTARQWNIGTALIVHKKAPTTQARKMSSHNAMQPKPPRGPSVSQTPRHMSNAPGGPDRASISTTRGSIPADAAAPSAATTADYHSGGAPAVDDDAVRTEYPSWPDAGLVPVPATIDATEDTWGGLGGVRWSQLEERIKSEVEDDVGQNDGVLFRYVPQDAAAFQQRRAWLDTAELVPDVARVVKSKKPPPKGDDATAQGTTANERRKTRHVSRSTAASSTTSVSLDANASIPAVPAGSGGTRSGSLRLDRRGSQARMSLSESDKFSTTTPTQSAAARGGAAQPPVIPLPTSASDGLVQTFDDAMNSVLTLPLTPAALLGTNDSSTAPLITHVVKRCPTFATLEEHITSMSNVIAGVPRNAGYANPASGTTPTAASTGGGGRSTSPAMFPAKELPPTQLFLVEGSDDVVLAAASLVAWCAWCLPSASPSSSGPNAASHPLLREVVARVGRDYTKPPTANEPGAAFVPDVAAAAGGDDDTDDEDLQDLGSDEEDDGEIDEVESESELQSSHKPLFATVTLTSRHRIDSFQIPARDGMGGTPVDPALERSVKSAVGGAGGDSPCETLAEAALKPLACLDALGVSAELSDVDFSISTAQHVVTAMLHRSGLYELVRQPIDELLLLERAVLQRASQAKALPPAATLRDMVLAASRAIERYALLVFAQCYASSETWRSHPERTFEDFLAYYPPLVRFLSSPDSLVTAEVPTPVFSDGLVKDGDDAPPSTSPAQRHLSGGGRQPHSARATVGRDAPAHQQRASLLPQTARRIIAAHVLGGPAGPGAGPEPWPLVRERVFPLDMHELLSATRRWEPAAPCFSLS